MFQKNLDAIKITNPKLAERLEKIDINSIDGIEVFEAESKDLIIAYKNTLLHSSIDPVREAKTTWNRTIKQELNKNDFQIVFGLGLGYLFKRAYVSANSKIFVLEPYIEVIRFVMEHVDFSKELSDSRVYITDTVGDIYEKLQNEYLSGDKVEFLFLNEFTSANVELLQNLTTKTFDIIGSRGSDENTIFMMNHNWAINFLTNVAYFPEARPLGYFEEKFAGKTALIIAAGPSMQDDIEKIKANQDKFVTIAVGRTFKTLTEAGIIPDFTVFADAVQCLQQIKGKEEFFEKTNAIFLSKGDRFAYEVKSKNKIIYFPEIDAHSKMFEQKNSRNPGFYKSGSSVSIISYYIAKAMGFSQIAFSGLDLAIIDNKLYSDGKLIEQASPEDREYLHRKFTYVKDKDGNDLPSRTDYALFVRQFNEIFTEEINLAQIINTSLKGAYIKEMEYLSFDDFVNTITGTKPDIDETITSVFDETKQDWNQTVTNVYSQLKDILNELNSLSPEINEIYNEYQKIYSELNETGKIEYDSDSFETLKKRAIDTRKRLTNNDFLTSFMQDILWSYTKSYITKPFLNNEDILNNIKLDCKFFQDLNKKVSAYIQVLTSSLTIMEEKLGVVAKQS